MKNKTGLFLVIILYSFFNLANAQELPGKRDSIKSSILNEKRVIQVVLPKKYKAGSTDKYDVLYVLDGDWNTKTMADVQQFIEGENYMPPTIIVGILNTDRNRDFLPTHVAGTKTSGGADKFLGFFKNELVPYINKTYPSNGDNAIFGHSFGGVFVTYALLTEPQLFKSYIAADPSFWWDSGIMIKMTAGKLAGLANLGKTFYISGREGQAFTGMGIPPMDTLLKKAAPAGLTWKVIAYPDETHGSVRLKSMYDGLKFSYAGFNAKGIALYPMAGILLKDKPVKIWYFDDNAKVHYTVDGTEPTITSPTIRPEIILTGPTKLKAKLFTSRDRYNTTTTGDFKAGTYLPASADSGKMKPGGFNYAYYEGQWDKLPDFKTLKTVKTGITDSSFDIDKLPRQENFALLITGQLSVKQDGYYLLVLDSDDGSKLYLGGQLLIDNDGLHGDGSPKTFILPLQKGFYPLRVEYFQKDGGHSLRLSYLTPFTMNFKNPNPIPLRLQYGLR